MNSERAEQPRLSKNAACAATTVTLVVQRCTNVERPQ
jgi:hypothetical protein